MAETVFAGQGQDDRREEPHEILCLTLHGLLAVAVSAEYQTRIEPLGDDVNTVFSKYLVLYPNANRDRSQYAKLACTAGRWRIANSQFNLLGDNAAVDVFAGQATINYLRKKASRLADLP